ncbi:class I SAM-dependent methyltransferase [Limnoraphis robusta]|uniref:class I SAM-dependent methyltransferase n=1 Tax=Limnoraphis robusta TaxID=1118279 RepID=UPI002B20F99D|nr:class I SAM-dependent methyltransferase [Limnoraphis robusta]MEA5497925.1 class I SAM-dependent methyltransferase [Limnoraphis robusta BA-68 BA1]
MHCPICGFTRFKDRGKRVNAKCVHCGAMERTRLMYLVLKTLDLLKPGMRILHIAPERGLIKIFSELSPIKYHPCDINPQSYTNDFCTVFPIDLCKDLEKLPRECFDLIVHNHVLEHLPCSVENILKQFTQILKPEGTHLFTVPIRVGKTDEDISENLTDEDRTERFGQYDHLRIFGTEDFIPMLQKLWDTDEVYIKNSDLLTIETYERAALPTKKFNTISEATIFYQSPARKIPLQYS